MKEKIAIVGTGIAGMGCAYFLKDKFDITFFEKNDYPGGHTNTITVDEEGKEIFIDTGFMVFNPVTYPCLTRLFTEIGVETMKTRMSFSVQHRPSSLEYCGSGLNGLFAQRKNLLRPSFYKMLSGINRFNKESTRLIKQQNEETITIREFVKDLNLGNDFLFKYLVPMSSAVWSTPPEKMLDFPAMTLIRFFSNHGFLGLNTQHQWFTIKGGSRNYRDRILGMTGKIKLSEPVKTIRRENGKVTLITNRDAYTFGKVILASHADESLEMLNDCSPDEKRLLSAFNYQQNEAVLHSDETVMPERKSVWSSWNYRIENKNGKETASTIYWMNGLQKVSDKKNYFVSINDAGNIDSSKVLRRINYTHPLFDVNAVKAQKQLSALNEPGPVFFCGSYFRYGFHEDALLSSIRVCGKILGKEIWKETTVKHTS